MATMNRYATVGPDGFVTTLLWATSPPTPQPGETVRLIEGDLPARPAGPGYRLNSMSLVWEPPPDSVLFSAAASAVRDERNRLLAQSDWTQGKDATARISKAQQAAWAVYRQALCDLTDQPGFPHSVQWPDRPA